MEFGVVVFPGSNCDQDNSSHKFICGVGSILKTVHA